MGYISGLPDDNDDDDDVTTTVTAIAKFQDGSLESDFDMRLDNDIKLYLDDKLIYKIDTNGIDFTKSIRVGGIHLTDTFMDDVTSIKNVDIRLFKDCFTIYDCSGNPALYFHANNICAFGTWPLVDETSLNDLNNDKQLVSVKTLKDSVKFKDKSTLLSNIDFRSGSAYNSVEMFSKTGTKVFEASNDGRLWFATNVPRVLATFNITNDLSESRELVMVKTLRSELAKIKSSNVTFKDGTTKVNVIDIRLLPTKNIMWNKVFTIFSNALRFDRIPFVDSGNDNDLSNDHELVTVKTFKNYKSTFKNGITPTSFLDLRASSDYNDIQIHTKVGKKAIEISNNGRIWFGIEVPRMLGSKDIKNDMTQDNELVLIKTLKNYKSKFKDGITTVNDIDVRSNPLSLYSNDNKVFEVGNDTNVKFENIIVNGGADGNTRNENEYALMKTVNRIEDVINQKIDSFRKIEIYFKTVNAGKDNYAFRFYTNKEQQKKFVETNAPSSFSIVSDVFLRVMKESTYEIKFNGYVKTTFDTNIVLKIFNDEVNLVEENVYKKKTKGTNDQYQKRTVLFVVTIKKSRMINLTIESGKIGELIGGQHDDHLFVREQSNKGLTSDLIGNNNNIIDVNNIEANGKITCNSLTKYTSLDDNDKKYVTNIGYVDNYYSEKFSSYNTHEDIGLFDKTQSKKITGYANFFFNNYGQFIHFKRKKTIIMTLDGICSLPFDTKTLVLYDVTLTRGSGKTDDMMVTIYNHDKSITFSETVAERGSKGDDNFWLNVRQNFIISIRPRDGNNKNFEFVIRLRYYPIR